jgi:nitrogen regulatory protein P-II 1
VILRKEKFPDVDAALKEAGVQGLTVIGVEGRGRYRGGQRTVARGTASYRPEYIDRVEIEILVRDVDVPRVIATILRSATTGSIGDGKIIVTSIDELIDIGSNRRGDEAV